MYYVDIISMDIISMGKTMKNFPIKHTTKMQLSVFIPLSYNTFSIQNKLIKSVFILFSYNAFSTQNKLIKLLYTFLYKSGKHTYKFIFINYTTFEFIFYISFIILCMAYKFILATFVSR